MPLSRQELERIITGLDSSQLLKALSSVGIEVEHGGVDHAGNLLDAMKAESPKKELWNDMKTAPVAKPRKPVHDKNTYTDPRLNHNEQEIAEMEQENIL